MKTSHFALALVGLLLVACSTTNAVPPLRSEFGDVPIPEGLVYVPDQSAFIESEHVRAGRVVYRSGFEPGSLVVSIQSGLEGKGWRLIRSSTFPGQGTAQVYEKGESSLQVRIWEGGLFNAKTYVELSGSRLLPRSGTGARTTAVSQ